MLDILFDFIWSDLCPTENADCSHDASLTNGTARDKKSHNAPFQHVNNISKEVETLLFLGYMEALPGQGLCNDDDEDDDVSEVIHAERVIITEEEEEVHQDTDTEGEEVREKVECTEERETEREKEQEEREEEKDREEKIENERVGEGEEERETDQEKKYAADVENQLEMCTEAAEGTALEEINTEVELLGKDIKVKIISHVDEETRADTNANAPTIKDSDPKSTINTDSMLDADLTAVIEQEIVAAETTPSVSTMLPAPAQDCNSAQKPHGPALSFTNAAAPFQEIQLGGVMVEEEPLLATKVEPLTNAINPNQAEGAKTKTCQCCTVM